LLKLKIAIETGVGISKFYNEFLESLVQQWVNYVFVDHHSKDMNYFLSNREHVIRFFDSFDNNELISPVYAEKVKKFKKTLF